MSRIGLIGCGAWGRHILRDLKACGAIVHVVAPSETSRRIASEHRADSIVDRLAALPPVDGYVVAVPTSLHAEIIDALLPSGRPIFTEKPMTSDLVSARRIANAAGDRVFVMHKWRYHPGIERMRQEIADGAVGEVLGIHIQRWGWGCPHADVNAIWILMPHDLSIVLHWLGAIPPLRFVRPTLQRAIDTGLVVQLGETGGPPITIDMSIAAPEHRRTFTIVGSRASLELRDSYDTAIRVRRGAPADAHAKAETIEIAQDMPLLLEIKAFLAHLNGGPPPMSSAHEGARIVERTAEIEAAARSA
ncbi:Gfo/Idh/MocA family protein [Dongia deserti]|uniref:Gfo/Idh/MocA family protein n=1 Tax=Dongia deserti TaxID=2268030 RepID=UPI000E647F3C|nr:Gfo/Idh/MocA family oxidoreductase [Dongia deserti]